LPTPQPIPPPSLPSGPLAHYLAHPGATTSHLLHRIGHVLAHLAVTLGPSVVGVAVAALVALSLARRAQARRMAEGARLVTVRTPPEVDPQGAATLWTNLVALLRPAWRRFLGGQPHLGFELTATDGGLIIAFWVPGPVPPGLVERAVEAAWPGARTETIPAGPPLVGEGVATGGELRLAVAEHFPLKSEHKIDPLRPLLGALSGLGEDESACVQILARPVTGRRLTRLHKAAAARRSGRPASRLGRLIDLFTPGPVAQASSSDPTRSADVADILDKAALPCWAITIRYAVAIIDAQAPDRRAAARLRGRAHAVASAFALFSGRNRLDRHRLRQLAALAHLPTDAAVPGLDRAGANAVPPPPAVARPAVTSAGRPASGTGPAAGAGGAGPTSGTGGALEVPKVLGDAQAGARRPVALSVPDARYHLHVMGATGSGKSTLLTNLALGDVSAGRGVVVIDPKGDLITDLCDRLPETAAARTVLIDPEDPDAAPVLNVLTGPDPDLVVDNLVGIFRSIFAAFWGPRTEDVLRAACLTLLRHSAATGTATSLADVPRLLGEDDFRAPRVAIVADDKVGLGGFWDAYEAMSEANRAQVIGPLMNKLRAFLLRDFVRRIVGRPDGSFDMGQVLDGGICLVRVPKGILGEETAKLLGSFVVAKVWQTATHRARLGQAARVDASLVVDECQNFLNLPRSFDEMLAEARGYRLSMVLAHQHLGQLPRELREAVSANARTKVWFSMSPEDAHALSRHVAPEVSEHDLSHLGAYTAAARLVVDGEETSAFTLRTRPAPPAVAGRADAVRAANRAAHRPPEPTTPASPLAGRTLPAVSRGGKRRGPGPGGAVHEGLRQDVHGALHGALPQATEPPNRREPPRQRRSEGSGASADSRG
jgi:hypothetical protein